MIISISSKRRSDPQPARKPWMSLMSLLLLMASAAPALSAEEVYKLRLGVQASLGSADRWNLNGVEANEEWIVIKVTDRKKFKIYHTTYLENKTWGSRQWFDHPVTDMRICLTDGFEKKDCRVINSDTAVIPEGKTIHDLSIDFKYSESGRSFTKNIVVAQDAKPE